MLRFFFDLLTLDFDHLFARICVLLFYLAPIGINGLPAETWNVSQHGLNLSISLLGFIGTVILSFPHFSLLKLLLLLLFLQGQWQLSLVSLVEWLLNTNLLDRLGDLPQTGMHFAGLEGLEDHGASSRANFLTALILLIFIALFSKWTHGFIFIATHILVNLLLVEVHESMRAEQKLLILFIFEFALDCLHLSLPLLIVYMDELLRDGPFLSCVLVQLFVLIYFFHAIALHVIVRGILRMVIFLFLRPFLFNFQLDLLFGCVFFGAAAETTL